MTCPEVERAELEEGFEHRMCTGFYNSLADGFIYMTLRGSPVPVCGPVRGARLPVPWYGVL